MAGPGAGRAGPSKYTSIMLPCTRIVAVVAMAGAFVRDFELRSGSVLYHIGNTARTLDQRVRKVAHVGNGGLQLCARQRIELQLRALQIGEKARVLQGRREGAPQLLH